MSNPTVAEFLGIKISFQPLQTSQSMSSAASQVTSQTSGTQQARASEDERQMRLTKEKE